MECAELKSYCRALPGSCHCPWQACTIAVFHLLYTYLVPGTCWHSLLAPPLCWVVLPQYVGEKMKPQEEGAQDPTAESWHVGHVVRSPGTLYLVEQGGLTCSKEPGDRAAVLVGWQGACRLTDPRCSALKRTLGTRKGNSLYPRPRPETQELGSLLCREICQL